MCHVYDASCALTVTLPVCYVLSLYTVSCAARYYENAVAVLSLHTDTHCCHYSICYRTTAAHTVKPRYIQLLTTTNRTSIMTTV
jgi:hypothetical protein